MKFFPRVLLLLCVLVAGGAEQLNTRPIIGLLTQSTAGTSTKYGDTYLEANYVKYIEAAGARAVPVLINMDDKYYEKMFGYINGILLPGGDINIYASPYERASLKFFYLAKKANEEGNYFPIWGTCQGFEEMTYFPSQERVITHHEVYDVSLPLNFTEDFRSSRLFRNAPDDVISILRTKRVTSNFHMFGMSLKNYTRHFAIQRFYRVISTNVDDTGDTFVSTMEARHFPFYATQWHPEKNLAEWNPGYDLDHSVDGVRVAQYMANFFVSECRKNHHKFPSPEEEIPFISDSIHPVLVRGNGFYETNYFFNTSSAASAFNSSSVSGA